MQELNSWQRRVAAYEKALALEPTSSELYHQLARTCAEGDQLSEAEATYRRALDASLEDNEYDSAIRGIWKLYNDREQRDKGIAILESLKPKMEKSAVLHELLGAAYKEAGEVEKANAAYTKWLEIRQKEGEPGTTALGVSASRQSDSRQGDYARESVRICRTRLTKW